MGGIMPQLEINFEIDRLVTNSRGRMTRASELRPANRITEALPPTDPHVGQVEDVVRLTGQNRAILDRLRQGPAFNSDLAKLSLKYTSRISDLRRHGFEIRATRQPGGLVRYDLKEAVVFA
jgi:hypothetical protein